jgi:hypothetical protein
LAGWWLIILIYRRLYLSGGIIIMYMAKV